MGKNKLVIGCLIFIAVFFFIGLGTGLIPKQDGGLSDQSSSKDKTTVASQYAKGGWMKMMDNLFAPFATPLDINRLTFSCKRSGDTFYLTQGSPSCKITIPKSDENYRKGKLRLKGQGAQVEFAYKPANGEAQDPAKWPSENGQEDPIRLVALEDGGTVSLKCLNCDEQTHRSVRVKIE